jgi:hypothetical protein
MNFLDKITVLILTYNEAPNIVRTLGALSRFSEIVVLDSGSTDGTVEIIRRYSNARCVTRPFDTHAAQWNYVLTSCGVERPWILALDADYVVPAALVDEIGVLLPQKDVSGFLIAFRYCICGRPLSATLYPAHVVLYRRERSSYVQEGHTQRAMVDGRVQELRARVDHDDRKPLSRWLASQQKYAMLEAGHLLSKPSAMLSRADRIRLMAWPAPTLVFFYTLIIKRCILDGWPGWLYVLQRTFAETLIALEIVDRRLRGRQTAFVESIGSTKPRGSSMTNSWRATTPKQGSPTGRITAVGGASVLRPVLQRGRGSPSS